MFQTPFPSFDEGLANNEGIGVRKSIQRGPQFVFAFIAAPYAVAADVEIKRDDVRGQMAVSLSNREVLAYQYADSLDTPHFWPVRSPSGKLLTVQHPPESRFPHHRSVWIADHVQLAGRKSVDFYHASKNRMDIDDAASAYRHRIRHVGFKPEKVEHGVARIAMDAVWEINGKTPVLDQMTTAAVHPLDHREYIVDLRFSLSATYGAVVFNSDWVHYAWPYVRMHPQFSGDQGGKITDDQGRATQRETNGQFSKWIDYSGRVDGLAEGLTIFSHPSNGNHKWLTREYGTFGPRRPDPLSGTKFTLNKGESIGGRVGILVHQGDVETGRVAERYSQYVEMTK